MLTGSMAFHAVILSVVEGSISNSGKQKARDRKQMRPDYRLPITDHYADSRIISMYALASNTPL